MIMQITDIIIREKPIIGESWMIILFLLCLGVIASVRVAYPKRINTLFKTFLNYRALKQIIREEGLFNRLPSVLTQLLFFISAALFLYEIDFYFNLNVFFDLHGLAMYMMYLLTLFVIYLIRWGIMEILKNLLIPFQSIEGYFYTTMQYNKVLGIFLLIISFIGAFILLSNVLPILWIGFITTVLFYIYRIVRGFQLGLQENISFSYLFLYICALEISPALAMAKLLITKL
jgi:hypothetical protein